MKLIVRTLIVDDDRYEIEPEDSRLFGTRDWPLQRSDPRIEGSAKEMLAIADAIGAHESVAFDRCGVDAWKDTVLFWTPHRSSSLCEATRQEAAELAAAIRSLLGPRPAGEQPETCYCTHGGMILDHPCVKCGHKHQIGVTCSEWSKRSNVGAPPRVGDYAIGSRVWPGTSKLIEEVGELQQVLGKLVAIAGATNHWSGDLRKMLIEELGDVSAAIRFFGTMNLTTEELTFVAIRSDNKLTKFREWQLAPKAPPSPPKANEVAELSGDVMGPYPQRAAQPSAPDAQPPQSQASMGLCPHERWVSAPSVVCARCGAPKPPEPEAPMGTPSYLPPPPAVWIVQHRYTGALALVYNRYKAKLDRDSVQHEYRLVTGECDASAPSGPPTEAHVAATAAELGEVIESTGSSVGAEAPGKLARWVLERERVFREHVSGLRARVQAFEHAEEVGLDPLSLHQRIDNLQEAIDRRPVVVPVEGGLPREVNVRDPHDGHSHLYVPSSEYERVLQSLRVFAEFHVNDGDEFGALARKSLEAVKQ